KLVQAEGLTDLSQFLCPGLKQSKPDEATLPAASSRLLQRHRALIASVAVLVMGTVNDHLGTPCRQPGLISVTQHGGIPGTTRPWPGCAWPRLTRALWTDWRKRAAPMRS